eukprot:g15794.t1
MARLSGERDDLLQYSHQLLHDTNELLQRSCRQDDQIAVLAEEIDEERQLLASCEADFATAATSASRLAYDMMREDMFDFEGIDVSAAPPDASVIPEDGLPTPGESFAKLLVNIEHVRSVMATYANHPRCLDKRVAETSDVGGDGEVGLEELVRYPPSDLVPGSSLAMERRRWGLVLIPFVVLAFGNNTGVGAAAAKEDMTEGQRRCCQMLGDEGGVPKECMLGHDFACKPLRFTVNLGSGQYDEEREVEAAFQQQLGLRQKEGCSAREWEGRCPPSATMLVAKISGGTGCAAAGCVEVDGVGERAAALVGDGADEDMLRAAVAQEVSWLRSWKGDAELSRRSERFAKGDGADEYMLRAAVAQEVSWLRSWKGDAELSRRSERFAKILDREATAQKALVYARTIPAKAVSALVKMMMDNKAMSMRKDGIIEALGAQLDKVKHDVADTVREVEQKLTTTEEALDSSMAGARAARGEIEQLKSELRETQERSRAMEAALGLCQEQIYKTDKQLGSCAASMHELESRAASLAAAVEAVTGQTPEQDDARTCLEDGAEDGDTPPETTRAPGDAHMAVW